MGHRKRFRCLPPPDDDNRRSYHHYREKDFGERERTLKEKHADFGFDQRERFESQAGYHVKRVVGTDYETSC